MTHDCCLRSDSHHRWITSREALACQGIPILKTFSHGVAVCTWAMDDYDNDDYSTENCRRAMLTAAADNDRTSRIGQAGNAMHAECVGLSIAYVLSQGTSKSSGSDARGTEQQPGSSSRLSPALKGMAAMIAGRGSCRRK